jgi:hypothetical protein
MSSRWNKDLRASLDELCEYQAVDAPSWFDAKERLDALSRDEEQRRSARGEGQRQSTRGEERRILVSNDLFTIETVDEEEDEDDDEDEEMKSEAQYGGIDDDGDEEDDEDGMTMEEIEARQAAEEAKEAAASKAAQESAEISKMMEKTQLDAEATTSKNEPSASKAKDDVSMEPGVAAGGNEADVGDPADLSLQCKQCDQKFPDQHSLVSRAVDAHPGAAFETVILKLVDDRFKALVEENNRKDARKEIDRVAEASAKADTLLQETTAARAKLSKKTRAARAKATQHGAQLQQQFDELDDQLIANFTRLVGLADVHLETTARQNIAFLLAKVTRSLGLKAQRLQEIAKSEHDKRTKEAVQREIDALDAEDALQTAQLAARQARSAARKEVLQAQLGK